MDCLLTDLLARNRLSLSTKHSEETVGGSLPYATHVKVSRVKLSNRVMPDEKSNGNRSNEELFNKPKELHRYSSVVVTNVKNEDLNTDENNDTRKINEEHCSKLSFLLPRRSVPIRNTNRYSTDQTLTNEQNKKYFQRFSVDHITLSKQQN